MLGNIERANYDWREADEIAANTAQAALLTINQAGQELVLINNIARQLQTQKVILQGKINGD